MKEISDVAHEYIVECENIAFDAHSRVCKPLMMDGVNNFYSSNGSPISHARVLEEHHTMQVALGRIHGKLDYAKTGISLVNEADVLQRIEESANES